MDAGGLSQMAHAPFNSGHGLAMPSSGLASRRGGQNIKPLSFDAMKSPAENDNGIPTPRTSRSHLLAGLRTAPKTATASSFSNNGPASPTTFAPQARNRNSMTSALYDSGNMYNGPKTSMPRFASQPQQSQQQQLQQQQLQQQQQVYSNAQGGNFNFTADQVLAPPQLGDVSPEQIDPDLHAHLLLTNAYLSEQQQRLQQQLRALQAAAQQFQGLNLNGQMQGMLPANAQTMQQLQQLQLQSYQMMQQQQQTQAAMYQQQQQQAQNAQGMMNQVAPQSNVYTVYDPATGQQTLYVDQQGQAQLQAQLEMQARLQAQMNARASPQYTQQAQMANGYPGMAQANIGAPRVQVSPPPAERTGFRNPSPPRRFDSPVENPAPLPPPSANAFRRGHKKSSSIANNKNTLSIATDDVLKASGPKTASFPITPSTAGYGPGQGRAGEHPVRQPRNPPSMDELKNRPTSKHEGSKNFVTRTRRSAVTNLVRARLGRSKDVQSNGSISPISESTEEIVDTPLTDNDSDSGRSGSGSLIEHDDAECSLPSSRTSTGSWGAIGSDRPSSRQKLDRSADSANSSDNEGSRSGSFASLLKAGSRAVKTEAVDGQRKAPMLVLTSAEKRKLVA
ncbi:hypothetical protein OQA88_13351 [Cercophora sp. LCS_1]